MLDKPFFINKGLFFKFFSGNYKGLTTFHFNNVLERSVSDLANVDLEIKYSDRHIKRILINMTLDE